MLNCLTNFVSSFIAILTLLGLIEQTMCRQSINVLWAEWKNNHSRQYANEFQEKLRFTIFQNNLNFIEKHNELYRKHLSSYEMGLNQFADMNWKEFQSKYLGSESAINHEKYIKELTQSNIDLILNHSDPKPPDNYDGRNHGLVRPIIDQGHCNSSYAISAVGCIEGQYFKRFKTPDSISVQQIIDCSFTTAGCDGGDLHGAGKYIFHHGIMLNDTYPYMAKKNNCGYKGNKAVANITYVWTLPRDDENNFKKCVFHSGPISSSINVVDSFRFYKQGIYDSKECDSQPLNHHVLAVGFGIDNSTQYNNGMLYWLIKNSWGPKWGEQGYFRIKRNVSMCGIAKRPYLFEVDYLP